MNEKNKEKTDFFKNYGLNDRLELGFTTKNKSNWRKLMVKTEEIRIKLKKISYNTTA